MKRGGKDPNPGRLWGVAHMDAGIWFTAATRRECVFRLGYASRPRRTHYSGGVYYYHAREGGHDAFVGRVRALLASGFTLEPLAALVGAGLVHPIGEHGVALTDAGRRVAGEVTS